MTDASLQERALTALRDVVDPEVGLNVVDLGLVYGVTADAGRVTVQLTMTTSACPLGEHLQREAEEKLRAVEGVESATVDLVWEPPWSADRISPAGKAQLGWGP